MEYLLATVVCVVLVLFYYKEKYFKAWIEQVKFTDYIRKEHKKEISLKEETIKKQKEVLYWISDGIHNIASSYTSKDKIEDLYLKNKVAKVGAFFAHTRILSEKIENDLYSEEEYQMILKFIQEDFHDFCHYKVKDIDLEKFIGLVGHPGHL